jgi:Strictosidine synthase
LYASKVDLVRGKRAGRLLEYDPATEETRVLASNLFFANGVSVDADETYVIVSQTFAMRLSKYHLSGPRQGDLETVLDSHELTGYTDGADCSWSTTGPSAGKCYVAVATTMPTVMKLMQVVPHPLDQILRGFLLMLPKWLAPKPVDYGCVVEVDMATGETRTLQDPDGTDQKFITGVTIHDNKLYLGSLHSNVVGVYDLS